MRAIASVLYAKRGKMSVLKTLILGCVTTMVALLLGLVLPGAAMADNPSLKVTPGNAETTVTIHESEPGILSATGCTRDAIGRAVVCIYVNGERLVVRYATVSNHRAPAGRGYISETFTGSTYVGPRLPQGSSWRKEINLSMYDGDKVCGSVEGLWVACVNISS
ncbi:hypothetical protein [Nonomuraea typhae]|uniref:hypothetical protein n=1 Tax=Nonomuraea typhae TaxID=2603600 RepID=UPI0012FCB191|nr:hypothetical protein [Nonomuraea typhae]